MILNIDCLISLVKYNPITILCVIWPRKKLVLTRSPTVFTMAASPSNQVTWHTRSHFSNAWIRLHGFDYSILVANVVYQIILAHSLGISNNSLVLLPGFVVNPANPVKCRIYQHHRVVLLLRGNFSAGGIKFMILHCDKSLNQCILVVVIVLFFWNIWIIIIIIIKLVFPLCY